MSRIRTFVAVDIDAAVRRKAKELIQNLASSTTAVRWVAPENLHLTLKFLGDVEDREVHDVCRAVGRAVAGLTPFHTFCQGVGAFPSRERPRTIWLGLEDRQAKLAELQEAVETAMADLGFRREIRQFRAHVTIGRVNVRHRRWGRLLEELARHAETELGPVFVEQCVIYSSELTPDGPIYTPMGRMPLGAELA